MIERALELRGPLDLAGTLGPLAHGRGDRTIRLTSGEAWLAFRTPDGPATLRLRLTAADCLAAAAWGRGAAHAIDGAGLLVGESDRPEAFIAVHPVLRRLQRIHNGLRLPQTRRVFHALLPSVLEQKVTGREAHTAYAAIVRAWGEPAPGPAPLRLQPPPDALAVTPYWAFHPLGVERKRTATIQMAASRARRVEETVAMAAPDAHRRLQALPGVGPWTSAEVAIVALGDADAVSVGDFHLPHLVSYALTGEPRGSDERMLELLAPWPGHRGRVLRLLTRSGRYPDRRGPRMAVRAFTRI